MMKSIIQKQEIHLSMYTNWKIKSLQSDQDLRDRFSRNFKIEFDIKIQLKFLKICLISYQKHLKLGFVSNSFWTKSQKAAIVKGQTFCHIPFCQYRKMCLAHIWIWSACLWNHAWKSKYHVQMSLVKVRNEIETMRYAKEISI
mgnify:CR=1 FL=1